MKIVDVDHLSFEYGNRRVLHNLNFSIRQGDYAVLTGENGAVKHIDESIVGRVGVGKRKGCDSRK